MLTTRMIFALTYSNANQKLLNAARDNHKDTTEELEKALEEGADLNMTDIRIKNEFNTIGYKYTPLMWAAYNGHINKVKYLIKKGANIYATTASDNTALHIAAREGHTHVVNYLADLYPDLLPVKGEWNRTPHDMAIAYGKYRKVVETFEQNYSNPYFGPIKNQLAYEIALLISGFIDDPIALKNLSMVNKAWNDLSKDGIYENHYKDTMKACLPKEMQKASWEEIFRCYYPSTPMPKDAFKGFIERLHTFYILGDKINMLVDKGTGEQIGEGIIALPFLLSHWIDEFPASKKYRPIADKEIENNLDNQLKAAQKWDRSLTIYRELHEASEAENKEANLSSNLYRYLSKQRRPIFEVNVKKEDALKLSKVRNFKFDAPKDTFISINNWRMAQQPYSKAKEAEIHQLSKFKFK